MLRDGLSIVGRRRWFLAGLLSTIVCVPMIMSAQPVQAQSILGAFEPFDSWWIQPVSGSLGVSSNGSEIMIDRDGDGSLESTLPISAIPLAARTNLRLTPTREILFAWGGACGTNGIRIHFFRIPPAPGTALTTIVSDYCVDRVNGAPVPRFYDTGLCSEVSSGLSCPNLGVSTQRVAVIPTGSAIANQFELVWIDLNNGVVAQTTNTTLNSNIGFMTVSPSGTQAFVQHDLPQAFETDYSLIDLCPGSLGLALNAGGGSLFNRNDVLQMSTTSVLGGNVRLRAFDQSAQPVLDLGPFTDCLAVSPPVGACCHGGSLTCNEMVTLGQCGDTLDTWLQGDGCDMCQFPVEACCFPNGQCLDGEPSSCTTSGGVTQGNGSTCSTTTCTAPDLSLDVMGPTTVSEGDLITYGIGYQNSGTASATNVALRAVVPGGATFVSATGGGDLQGNVVVWNFASIAANSSGSVSYTVRAPCGSSIVTLAGASVSLGDTVGNFAPTPNDVDTMLTPLASAPVSLTISSLPSAGPPVPSGATLTHDIAFNNTGSVVLRGVQLVGNSADGFFAGAGVSFDQVLDDAGGTLTNTFSQLSWSGDLPPGLTTLSFTTVVDACVDSNLSDLVLNSGVDLALIDACDGPLALATPPPLPVLHNVIATLVAPNLSTPADIDSPATRYQAQLARPGDVVSLELRLASGTGTAQSGVATTLSLLDFGFSSLVSSSAPGTSFDTNTGELTWAGDLPASGDVSIVVEAELVECRGTAILAGRSPGSPAGCVDIASQLVIAAVPTPPASDYLVALGQAPPPAGFLETQVRLYEPDTSLDFSTQLCLPTEFVNMLGVGAGGDIWLGFLPTIRYNPRTLRINNFDTRRFSDIGFGTPNDIAVDSRTGEVYFVGTVPRLPSGTNAGVARYVPSSDLLTLVVQDGSSQGYGRAVVDDDGMLIVTNSSADLIRIDPSDWSLDRVSTGETTRVLDVSIDLDGDLVTMHRAGSLIETDSQGLDPAVVIDSGLATTFPEAGGNFWQAMTVDRGTDSVYVSSIFAAGLGVIDRDASGAFMQADVAIPFSTTDPARGVDQLHFVPVPEPSAFGSALAALGTIVGIRIRQRARERRAKARAGASIQGGQGACFAFRR